MNFWPDQFDARGHSYTAEKMKDAWREHARKKPARTKSAIDKETVFPGGSGERRRKQKWSRIGLGLPLTERAGDLLA